MLRTWKVHKLSAVPMRNQISSKGHKQDVSAECVVEQTTILMTLDHHVCLGEGQEGSGLLLPHQHSQTSHGDAPHVHCVASGPKLGAADEHNCFQKPKKGEHKNLALANAKLT